MKASIHAGSASEAAPAGEHRDAPAFVSIAPFFRLLGRYHRVLLFGLVALVVVWGAGAVLLRSILPGVTTSSIGIRFAFQGVSVGQYPNGLRFSPNDVVAPEVLEQVYRENGLHDILSFDRFKKSVFITQSNRALDQLESEYAIKLRDSRLSAPERRQLEKEFLAASDGLRTDSYLIKYRGDGDSRLPSQLYEQVLLAIPATWAELAAERRGVLSYDIEIGTAAPVSESQGSVDDVLQAVEFLRLTTANVRSAAYLVAELPGANLARGEGGETVSDLTTELDVFGSLTVMPLYVTGIRLAAATNPSVVESVLTSRVESERRVKNAADGRASDLERALQLYVANSIYPDAPAGGVGGDAEAASGKASSPVSGGSGVIAQVGGGFIEDIIRTRDAAQDIKYRQGLNDKVVEAKLRAVQAAGNVDFAVYALEQVRHPGNTGYEHDPARFAAQAKSAGARLQSLSAKLHALYELISHRNLNPGSTLFTIDRPLFSVHTAGVDWSSAVLGGFGFITLAMIGLVVACAVYDYRQRDQAG